MIKFNRAQLVSFVRSLDRNLDESVEVLIIGGAAAQLEYGATIKTSDIDVFNVYRGSDASIGKAATQARNETGLDVSIGSGSVADLPYNYEDRIKEVRGLSLKNLSLLVPDKYDLVLSKTVRGYEHDIDAIESIHKHHPLSQKTLLDRFDTEFKNIATTDKRNLLINMVLVVDRLYGEDEAQKLAIEWDIKRK